MSHYLSAEEHQVIKKARQEEGLMMKDIAKRFNICEATVSKICNGTTVPRGAAKIRKGPPKGKMADAKEIEYEDFSILPKNVLFQHVRACNFIG